MEERKNAGEFIFILRCDTVSPKRSYFSLSSFIIKDTNKIRYKFLRFKVQNNSHKWRDKTLGGKQNPHKKIIQHDVCGITKNSFQTKPN